MQRSALHNSKRSIRLDRPDTHGVALDFSPTMLTAARERFAGDDKIQVVEHNLNNPLPELGLYDVVVSSFAIHHCTDERKKQLYEEIYQILEPGGIFCNLEHVSSATPGLHKRFLEFMNVTEADEDPSNKLVNVGLQMEWLRKIGFVEVDCYWKWMEMALFGGVKR